MAIRDILLARRTGGHVHLCHMSTRGSVDLIVLDVWLPGMDGLATLARLRERQVDAQIVLISGHGNIESAVRAIKAGAKEFSPLPPEVELIAMILPLCCAIMCGTAQWTTP